MSILDNLIIRITGFDPGDIKTEQDKKAYNSLRRYYQLLLISLLIGLPGALYVFITIYFPELRK